MPDVRETLARSLADELAGANHIYGQPIVVADAFVVARTVLAHLTAELGSDEMREAVIDAWRIVDEDRHLARDDATAALAAITARLTGQGEV